MKIQKSNLRWLKDEVISLPDSSAYRCHGKYYSPDTFGLYEAMSMIVSFFLFIWLLYIWMLVSDVFYGYYQFGESYHFKRHYVVGAGLLIFWQLTRIRRFRQSIFLSAFGPRVDVIVLHDGNKPLIKVGGWLHYTTYDLTIKSEIHIEPHRKALIENERARLNPRDKPRPNYYSRSEQVVLYNGENRIILAEIFDSQDISRSLKNRIEENISRLENPLIQGENQHA